jgi:hypothetical protein
MRNFGAGWIDGWTPIRDAILAKARWYGDLDLPMIVAVNVDTFNLDPIDESQALFGQEQFIYTVGKQQEEPRFERAPNMVGARRSTWKAVQRRVAFQQSFPVHFGAKKTYPVRQPLGTPLGSH